ncbi:MAG: zinc ribbon domain-containing protein [Clostridium sp.]|uniref:zinc ribbon domain-containing protein n=1 Tax=Clostridium sp. TaxID=1506 RepID=UPI003D6CE979
MKFCTKCGEKLEEGNKYCMKCGQSVLKQVEPSEISPTIEKSTLKPEVTDEVINKPSQSLNIKLPKLNLNKTQKKIAIAVAIGLVIIIGFYKVGESLNSRDKVVARFSRAIATNNSSKLASYIVSTDPKLKVDAKSMEALLKYIDKTPSYGNEIIKSINNQSVKMALSPILPAKSTEVLTGSERDIDPSSLFTLEKKGKTWLFYDKYVFDLKPVYINVYTNYKDTQIFLDDKLVCTANQDDFAKEIGPYTPGLYEMRATLKGEYISLEQTIQIDLIEELDLSDVSQTIKQQEIYLDGYEVAVDSEYEDAKLIANGKDTGILIKDAKNFGPVSKDSSVKLYAQKDFPWGTVKSGEVPVDGSSGIYLEINAVNESLKNSVMETVNTSCKEQVEAFKSRSITKVKSSSGNAMASIITSVEDMIDGKNMYTGGLTKSAFDLDSIKTYQMENKYYAQVSSLETYNSAYYYEGETIPSTVISETITNYTLIYDESSKKWTVDDMNAEYDFNDENKKEFTF